MNVLHLQLSGGIGGISILTKEINRFSKHNNFFYFVFEGGSVADEIANDGANVFVSNDKNTAFVSGAKKLVKYCKKNNIEIIIGHTGSPIVKFFQIYAVNHLKGVKSIVYLHSNANDELNYKNPLKRFVCKGLYQKCHDKSVHTVAISQSVKDSFVNIFNFDESKITVIYNGIDCKKFYTNNLSTDTLNLIYVGRLFKEKGIDLLIKSISELPKDINVKLQIIGKGTKEYTNSLYEIINSNNLCDKVVLLGEKTNVEEFLSNSNFFVHPAIWEEGFGITIIEALASSLPCIAFNKGAIPEIITNNFDGLIVSNTSEKALAQSITNAYSIFKDTKKYNTFRSNARETALKFDITNTTRKLEKLYD